MYHSHIEQKLSQFSKVPWLSFALLVKYLYLWAIDAFRESISLQIHRIIGSDQDNAPPIKQCSPPPAWPGAAPASDRCPPSAAAWSRLCWRSRDSVPAAIDGDPDGPAGGAGQTAGARVGGGMWCLCWVGVARIMVSFELWWRKPQVMSAGGGFSVVSILEFLSELILSSVVSATLYRARLNCRNHSVNIIFELWMFRRIAGAGCCEAVRFRLCARRLALCHTMFRLQLLLELLSSLLFR